MTAFCPLLGSFCLLPPAFCLPLTAFIFHLLRAEGIAPRPARAFPRRSPTVSGDRCLHRCATRAPDWYLAAKSPYASSWAVIRTDAHGVRRFPALRRRSACLSRHLR